MCDADVAVDNVAYEARAGSADQQRRDVIAQRQRERKDAAGHDAGQGQGHDHIQGGAPLPGPEVGGGLQVGLRNSLEGRISRDDHEGQPDVGEDNPHRPVGVAEAGRREMEEEKAPVENAIMIQDQDPGVDPRQVARPERQEHGGKQGRLDSARRDARHVIGKGESEHGVGEGDRGGEGDGPQDDEPIGSIGDQGAEVVDIPDPLDRGREGVDLPEGRDQQQHQRREVDDDEPGQPRSEQQGGPHPGPPPQQRLDAGDAPAFRPAVQRGDRHPISKPLFGASP